MPERVPDPSVAHFGENGMRRFSVPGSYGVQLPDVAREVLATTGVPLHVTPYFTAAGDTDGLTLGMTAGHAGLPAPSAGTTGCASVRTRWPTCACGRTARCRRSS